MLHTNRFRLFTILLITLAIIICFALQKNTRAEKEQLEEGNKWALLVGINNYGDPNISMLKYAVADVAAFRDVLIDKNICDFKADRVYLMTDKDEGNNRPTNSNVMFRLENLAGRIKPEDTFLFYFSGHGVTRGERSYLLAVNSDTRTLNTLQMTAIPLELLQQAIQKIRAKRVLFVIDACRNDPEAGKGDKDNLMTDEFVKDIRIKSAKSVANISTLPSYRATLFACSLGERAYEMPEKKRSVFSYHLLEGLKGEAANAEGNVTVVDLAKYARKKVVEWTTENFSERKQQTPWLDQSGDADFVLVKTPDASVEEISNSATLVVSSEPPNATVYVNGIKYGVAPRTAEIDTGITGERSIEVGLKLPGYKSKTVRLTVARGRTESLDNIKLTPLPEGEITPFAANIEGNSGQANEPDFQSEMLTRDIDGAVMKLVSAGEFLMGNANGDNNEKPPHTVYLNSFYIDVKEVTNAQYKQFLLANPLWQKDKIDSRYHDGDYLYDWEHTNYPRGKADHPVVYVSWYAACAYAEWVRASLPTEAQWEKAGRGGLVAQKFPFKGKLSHDCANYDSMEGNDQWETTAPVGSFLANGYGLYDMAGNAAEWCSDGYSDDYYKNSPKDNPTGPGTAVKFKNYDFISVNTLRVIRGGSWYDEYPDFLRCAYRNKSEPTDTSDYVGFRCVFASK